MHNDVFFNVYATFLWQKATLYKVYRNGNGIEPIPFLVNVNKLVNPYK